MRTALIASLVLSAVAAARQPNEQEQQELDDCKAPCPFTVRLGEGESLLVRRVPHATRLESNAFSADVPEGWDIWVEHLGYYLDELHVSAEPTSSVHLRSVIAPKRADGGLFDPAVELPEYIKMPGKRVVVKAGDLTFYLYESQQTFEGKPCRQWVGTALRGKILYSLDVRSTPESEPVVTALLSSLRVKKPEAVNRMTPGHPAGK